MAWIETGLLLAVSLVGVGLLCEVVLRLANISYPNFYESDPDTAVALHAGAVGWWHKENKNFVRINRHGFRDGEHCLKKTPGTLRIAILGNSFCEAMQVPLEKTFWAEIERVVAHCPAARGRPVEVLNFGVSNFGTTQNFLMLQKRVWQYEPDIIVLTLLTATDVIWNSALLSQYSLRPYFSLEDEKLVLDDSFLNHPAYMARRAMLPKLHSWLLDRSRLWQVIVELKTRIKTRLNWIEDGNPRGREIYFEPTTPEWKTAWQITETLIQTAYAETVAQHARFLLVTLDNPIQVNPDPIVRQSYMDRAGLATLLYPDWRLGEFAARAEIPALILAPILQQYAEQRHVYLHGFSTVLAQGGDNDMAAALGRGHWNETGHQVVGRLIAEAICSKVLTNESGA